MKQGALVFVMLVGILAISCAAPATDPSPHAASTIAPTPPPTSTLQSIPTEEGPPTLPPTATLAPSPTSSPVAVPTNTPEPTNPPLVLPTPAPTSTVPVTAAPTSPPTETPEPTPLPLITREAGSTIKWIDVEGPWGKTIRATIVWPEGPGPFPVVVVLHGTEGFKQKYIDLTQDFAREGFIAVAGCWFEGTPFPPNRRAPPEPIDCPNGPTFRGVSSASIPDALTLVNLTGRLEDANPGSVGLWGQSRGASMSLVLASTGAEVKAVVAAAAAYAELPGRREMSPVNYVQDLRAPVLILHGTADNVVAVTQARGYAAKLVELEKEHEVRYFDNAPHQLALFPPTKDDALRLAVEFFSNHLNP